MGERERSGPTELESAVALWRAGQINEACVALQTCAATGADVARLALALANDLADLGRLPESIAHYQRAIAAWPQLAAARQCLAAAWLQLGDFDAAIAESRAALALQPQYPLALNTLGVALARRGQTNEAVMVLTAALRADPGYAKAAYNLGNVLDQCERRDEAIAAFRRALELDPQLSHAAFDLAALGAVEAPPQMPRSYVVTLFNDYAPTFDRHLEELHYLAPRMLLDAVLAVRGPRFEEVVDLGCGTGMVGALFRPHAARLVGVDLAGAMIAASRQRGVYDELVPEDVVEYLRGRPAAVDLLLAADVLIYFGAIEDFFAAAAASLRSDGLFAFSIEVADGRDFQLQASRRYAHSPRYIRRLAAAHRWTELAAREGSLRDQGVAGTRGIVFVYRAE